MRYFNHLVFDEFFCRKLLTQLEQFKASARDKTESQAEGDGANIVYQLSYRPEQARLSQTSRVAELESRLHRLESILGSTNDKLTRLTSVTNKGTLLETAQYLSATASLLDSAQLDHIEGRLACLQQKLDAITEKKKQIAQDEEKDKMVSTAMSLHFFLMIVSLSTNSIN